MKKVKEEYVLINLNKPDNLMLEELIKPEIPYFVPIRRDDGTSSYQTTAGKKIIKHLPAIYYFVHVLLERQHSDNDSLRCKYAKSYIKMFSRDIEPIKSKNYFKFIWGILRGHKIVEDYDINEPTKYKQSARGYYFKFSEKYSDAKIVQHQVLVKKSIADKLNNRLNNRGNNKHDETDISSITTDKQFAHQYLALRNIRFDSDLAKQHVDKLLADKVIDINRYNTCLIYINIFINGRIKTTHSDKCNRYFTPVNEMPKELRPFIKDAEGNSLVDLDFGSFNAFAVYKIINTKNQEYNSNAEKIAFEVEEMFYKRLLSGDDFYKDFKDVFFPDEELSRDQIKDIVLWRWFNGKLNSHNKYRKHMLKRLPKISQIIDSLKVERYENFSNTAMKMESELVNDIIYKKFIDLHPDAVMYVIFDSFLVEQKYAAQLKSLMQEEGNNYFNIKCIVKAMSLGNTSALIGQ
jgi:hypothetical protein